MCHCIKVKVVLLARILHLILSFKTLRKYPEHPSPPKKKNYDDVYVHVLQLNLRRNFSLKFV